METLKTRILLVDDGAPQRISNELILTKQGYQVETANNGTEAMEKLEAFFPHLIIMDTTTSQVNGIECCRRIKSSKRTRDIKFVMVSANDDYLDITEAFAAGCDDYVVKPFDRQELLLTIRNILKFSLSTSSLIPNPGI